MKGTNYQYEVLNPWADLDPVPLRGISPRVTDLAGKTIGLFRNWKVAAGPILTVVERKLKDRFPTLSFSWYLSDMKHGLETEGKNKTNFEEWAKGVDTVIAAIGD